MERLRSKPATREYAARLPGCTANQNRELEFSNVSGVQQSSWMRRRHAVFSGRVAGIALLGNNFSLTCQTALQLRLNFVAASLLERIGAATDDQHAADRNQDRQGPHPLILGTNFSKANPQAS